MGSTSRHLRRWPLLITAVLVVGCSSDDQRLVDQSRQSVDRQAEQNRLVEANNRQVIDATQKLVEADAQTRQEAIQLQHEIQTERSGINEQRDVLEQERRQIAEQRNRDPIVAESIKSAVGLIVAALPLVVCLFVLRGLFHKSDDAAMADVLIEELFTHEPLLAETEGLFLPHQTDTRCLPLAPPSSAGGLSLQVLATATGSADGPPACVVVVEGSNDIEFLRRISCILHQSDSAICDLSRLESDERLVFVTGSSSPFASISIANCTNSRQFCLFDREVPPVSQERQRLVDLLNRRADCQAVLTAKRAMENYLHPAAVRDASGVELIFGDFDDVADVAAQLTIDQSKGGSWESLSRRARRRLRDKAKKWLNRDAVDRMTPERLAERDPDGEVIGWLRTIAELATAPVDTSV
jgi:hypothetical protein